MSGENAFAKAALTAFLVAFDDGEVKGLAKYGAPLSENTDIDAYQYAMEEAADLVKYLTLQDMRYRAALEEIERLRAELARLSADGG